MKPFV